MPATCPYGAGRRIAGGIKRKPLRDVKYAGARAIVARQMRAGTGCIEGQRPETAACAMTVLLYAGVEHGAVNFVMLGAG